MLLFVILDNTVIAAGKPMATKEEQIKATITESNHLLEDAILRSLKKTKEQYIKKVVTKGCDYYLSVQAFEMVGNPYKNMDLNPLIVAYMVAKQKTDVVTSFFDLPLITMEINYRKDNGISYATVNLKPITESEIFKELKVEETEEVKETFRKILKEVNRCINGQQLAQENFLILHQGVSEEVINYIEEIKKDLYNPMQITLVDVSTSLLNRVPYQWGGKASHSGYDNSWYTMNENGEQKGLDCSGYIQWVLRTAGASEEVWKNFTILGSLEKYENVTKENLQIGDLGILHDGSKEVVNHVGMYMGDGRWIHCSSGANTVVLNKTDMFTEFVRLPNMKLSVSQEDKESLQTNPYTGYSGEDIYLLAQLIHHEASGEGLNGWIAVAEVVKNRIASNHFEKCTNIRNTIFQKGQFENVENILQIKPTEEEVLVAKEVMSGALTIFNNPSVLYFRNNGGSTEDWGVYPYYTTINNHQFYLQKREGEKTL